jgi:uncharacterized protein
MRAHIRLARPETLGICSLVLASLACAEAPPAVAQPRRPAPAAEDTRPLLPQDLTTDADVARALRESYTKYEHMIPMRDGVRLFTSVYVPKDRTRTYPMILLRTPYAVAPYGVDNVPEAKSPRQLRGLAPSPQFVRDGYILVGQDVRGRMMSEGAFVDVRPLVTATGGASKTDESTDAWDTIDWLVKNVPASSGKVGIWGISYPGFYAAQAAVNAHPALKAVSPQAPVTDWFVGDDFHHNGAFFLAEAFDFYSSFGKPRPKPVRKAGKDFDYDAGDAYDFFLALGPVGNADTKHLHGEIAFWNDAMAHGARDDFWKARDPRPAYKNAKPAILTVGGWFDKEDLWGTLATYRAFDTQSPGAEVSLVVGPWGHGGWQRGEGDRLGDVTFGAKTSAFFRDTIEFPFFQRHLKGRPSAPGAQAEAWIFETGTNLWHAYPTWPPPDAKPQTLYFHGKGRLGMSPPAAGEDGGAGDSFVSDPSKPVPYYDKPSPRIAAEYMAADQRFAARRPDVLVYETDPLDGDVTLAGPLQASLSVTVTGTDADFIVKLVDVYPADAEDPEPNPSGVRKAGYQQLVRGEVMRGKFRDGFESPKPFVPGQPTLVRFGLPDVCHTFRMGHRIMVQVQSTWFPMVDRNPQTFVDIYHAKESDFVRATHTVLRTPERPSGLQVLVQRGRVP